MNNYSLLQRFLHRSVLSSKLIREITFDIEQSIFFKKYDQYDDSHVFVTGLARSGTTSLLNAIYDSNQFASLTYDDMPFILAPNFWKKISPSKSHTILQERAHGDSVIVSTNSPEAFEEVFWKTFNNDSKNKNELFKKFISLVLKKNYKTRYLSKNNQNIRRLELICEISPHSIILIPFRDPLQQSLSLLSQHIKFSDLQKQDRFIREYMKWIGHSEFGMDYKEISSHKILYPDVFSLNHWLEQWHATYSSILHLSKKNDALYFICYESLCNDPKVWVEIKNLLKINQDNLFLFKESKKDINQNFDSTLYDKCLKLYESLVVSSL